MLKSLFALMIGFCMMLMVVPTIDAENHGAENIVLQAPKRGDVPFAHALHQETLDDCMVCHELFPKVTGVIERLKADGSMKKKQVMKQCRACHRATKAGGGKTGPITCAGCHKRQKMATTTEHTANETFFNPADGPAEQIRIARLGGPNPATPGDPADRPLKEFTIIVDDLTLEIAPGVHVDTWAFGFEGQKASVPGPEIRVQEGDFVRVYFKNTHEEPHTIHFHGLNAPFHSDGVPGLSQHEVEEDEVFIYEFVAKRPGTHVYHCHFQTLLHLDMGMYGAFIVEAKDEIYKVDRELVWFFDEWSVIEEGKKWYDLPMAGFSGKYNYFTINSVAWPKLDAAITGIKEGEKIRVRMINMGYANHSMHIHGHKTSVTHFDGYPVKDPYYIDTIPIAPGQRIDFIFEADNPGIFPAHCHVVPHVSNDGDYPGGLLTGLVYEGFELGKLPETVAEYSKRHFTADKMNEMKRH
jgi:plastocyanin